jgi:hypothetical protein
MVVRVRGGADGLAWGGVRCGVACGATWKCATPRNVARRCAALAMRLVRQERTSVVINSGHCSLLVCSRGGTNEDRRAAAQGSGRGGRRQLETWRQWLSTRGVPVGWHARTHVRQALWNSSNCKSPPPSASTLRNSASRFCPPSAHDDARILYLALSYSFCFHSATSWFLLILTVRHPGRQDEEEEEEEERWLFVFTTPTTWLVVVRAGL